MDCRVWSQKMSCNITVVFNHFDRDSFIFIYIYICIKCETDVPGYIVLNVPESLYWSSMVTETSASALLILRLG